MFLYFRQWSVRKYKQIPGPFPKRTAFCTAFFHFSHWRNSDPMWVLSECWVASVMSNSLPLYRHSPPGSSVHGILQARILEWVTISSSRGSSRPRDLLCLLHLQASSLSLMPPGKPHGMFWSYHTIPLPYHQSWTSIFIAFVTKVWPEFWLLNHWWAIHIVSITFSFFISRKEIIIATVS